ncbi:MAG: S10 family peptidase [Steroidobacteraceae bacterium]
MKIISLALTALVSLTTLHAATPPDRTGADTAAADVLSQSPRFLSDEQSLTQGSVTVGGQKIDYQAEAGLLVVHLTDPMDADPPLPKSERDGPLPPQPPEAAMSYVAYFKGKSPDTRRPVTFIFNGGPGSSTVWLHMGAFGPKRVLTLTDSHTPAAPYRVVNNDYSLLDVSDLVFIDAPGTGFGHLRGEDKEKAFFGVDPDANAFANFIVEFLGRHGRWNSPKYLFGESYGTTRAAVLARVLQEKFSLDLNGVILLSQILSFDNSVDEPQLNPGVDQAYALALPTYAATAWYHKRLPDPPAELAPFLAEVESFALGDYLTALAAGAKLDPARRTAIAQRLHRYTGLPVDYLERANLRVNGGEFDKTLLGSDVTAGRLDSRFSGPTLDPLSQEAQYDPQSAAISSAYVSAYNDYVRGTLKFGDGKLFKASANLWTTWDFLHRPPGYPRQVQGATNVMPDLAVAMQRNPNLKVQMHGGYYDLATPFFAAEYELAQLPMQQSLQKNIEVHLYESGHMVYARDEDLAALHANTADFIRRTHAGGG